MTPDKNFRMSKASKTQIALMKGSSDLKAHCKKLFIEAQVCEEAARRAALRSKDDEENKGRGAVAPE